MPVASASRNPTPTPIFDSRDQHVAASQRITDARVVYRYTPRPPTRSPRLSRTVEHLCEVAHGKRVDWDGWVNTHTGSLSLQRV